MGEETPGYISNYDSATAMLRATARCLRGQDFPTLGVPSMERIVPLANRLPPPLRRLLYTVGAGSEARPKMFMNRVKAEQMARWACDLYPRDRFPAVAIGSSNGALTHLWTALGIPWLPQTLFLPVLQLGIHPDNIQRSMEAGIQAGRKLLDANPDLQLHHMHDPSQDRLNLYVMTYFRVKRLILGAAYEQFLQQVLKPSGTIFLVECEQSWPATRVGNRHIFQSGAVGGTSPAEYLHGSERVEQFLRRWNSSKRRWNSPPSDGQYPEAEWGFAPALRDDVERFAREQDYRVVRVVFEYPMDPSPLIADLYRWWYERLGRPTTRLLVESFILMEPYWALRTGSIPFWTIFNVKHAAQQLIHYLEPRRSFDEINMMLFSNGLESIGQASIDEWRSILKRAREKGRFVGVEEEKFPLDFASLARYHTELKKIRPHYQLPKRMTLEEFNSFLDQTDQAYPVEWHGRASPA